MIYALSDLATIAASLGVWYFVCHNSWLSRVVLAEILLSHAINWIAVGWLDMYVDTVLIIFFWLYLAMWFGLHFFGRLSFVPALYIFSAIASKGALNDAFFYGYYPLVVGVLNALILLGCVLDKHGRDLANYCSHRLNFIIRP